MIMPSIFEASHTRPFELSVIFLQHLSIPMQDGMYEDRGDLHALWNEYRFADGGVIYLKCSEGQVTIQRPRACSQVAITIF